MGWPTINIALSGFDIVKGMLPDLPVAKTSIVWSKYTLQQPLTTDGEKVIVLLSGNVILS